MQIYSQLAPLALGGAHGSAVAMGFFDGIHIGHRAVINGAVEWAKAHGAAPAVFTFRLPTENKMKGKRLLSTEDKHALIASLGVEHYLCPDFEEIKAMTPEQFVLGIIRDCNARALFCGENFTFGAKAAGTPELLRPANQPPQQPGQGWGVFETPFGDVAVVNLIGRCGMDFTPDNPFLLVERILPRLQTRLICVEIHAEATSEKQAMAWMLDGRVSAVWGTHTHVQTADEEILPNGTGRITDLGMTGPANAVLGITPEQSIGKFLGDPPRRYEAAMGAAKLEGAIFEVDSDTGRCRDVQLVRLR